jgi:CheY-like chemotaxis protein/two-component sensor histidine kinase
MKLAEEALRQADRRKDDFLGMLSHELRNPLAPLRNASFILEHADPLGEQAARARGVIRRQADHLASLVDDLLDVTRITRGRVELRRRRVELRDVVARTAEDFRTVVEAQGARLEVSIPEAPIPAETDPVRIAQVLGNLLQNAAKFTRAGDRIAVSLARAGDAAELSVRDTGAGIDAAVLPTIFEPFVQGARTLDRARGGLGLALVKALVELHGGSVQASSPGVGQGAEFKVRLPVAREGWAGTATPLPTPVVAARRGLVVDDNRDGADTLAQVVELLGHSVEVAYDGPSAVRKAQAYRPDVVLCDIGLPGMSGYEVARALRAEDQTLQLYALTGYAQAEDVLLARQAGFTGHVAKPVDFPVIQRLLAAVPSPGRWVGGDR